MAYNLEPLVRILEQMLLPEDHRWPWFLDPSKRSLTQSLLNKAKILKEFLENSSFTTSPKVRSFESRIRDAAYSAEDVIESHLADQLRSRKKGESIMVSPPADLLQTIEDYKFQCLLDEMVDIMDGRQMPSSALSSDLVSPRQDLNPRNIVVGIENDLNQLKNRLMVPQSKLEIIPIVGMGGIGKTTLASTLYNDSSLVSHFDKRAWITISQSYNVREIVIGLLKCVFGKLTDEIIREDNDKLTSRLYKILWGWRYLIVLDDTWSSQVWDEIKMFFPDDINGSRIIVTTREQSVANDVDSHNLRHNVNFLNEVESWNLLREKVFAEESCPRELEEVGKSIAISCKGLPLAIHIVGGVLLRLGRIQESWIQVAEDVRSPACDNDEQFSNILSLSYNHLPYYLKPCFLYMSAFPEDFKIKPSKLMKLWIAEGFLKPILGKSLEEVGEVYLKELVERSLLLVYRRETKRDVKSYIMHNLLRDLCIRKACEEKFLYVAVDASLGLNPKDVQQRRRLSICTSYDHMTCMVKSANLASTTRSLLFFGSYPNSYSRQDFELPCHDVFGLQLLRVLDILTLKLGKLPKPMEKLVNLRYLATSSPFSLVPSWIFNLCNLQTFIFHQDQLDHWLFDKIPELLDMPHLRHIKFKGHYPLFHLHDGECVALQKNLQTLSTIGVDNSFSKILEAMPNLKCLGIGQYKNILISSTIDLTILSKLEALKCKLCSVESIDSPSLLSLLILPPSLKKLTLMGCRIPLGYMERVGVLPNLEILKLQDCYFESLRWELIEGEYCQLRLLVLERLGLEKWVVANETSYPRLEHLIIQSCSALEEIPSGIGEIPTLEMIELHGRSTISTCHSLVMIQQEQIELGNDFLQFRVNADLPARLSLGMKKLMGTKFLTRWMAQQLRGSIEILYEGDDGERL